MALLYSTPDLETFRFSPIAHTSSSGLRIHLNPRSVFSPTPEIATAMLFTMPPGMGRPRLLLGISTLAHLSSGNSSKLAHCRTMDHLRQSQPLPSTFMPTPLLTTILETDLVRAQLFRPGHPIQHSPRAAQTWHAHLARTIVVLPEQSALLPSLCHHMTSSNLLRTCQLLQGMPVTSHPYSTSPLQGDLARPLSRLDI